MESGRSVRKLAVGPFITTGRLECTTLLYYALYEGKFDRRRGHEGPVGGRDIVLLFL